MHLTLSLILLLLLAFNPAQSRYIKAVEIDGPYDAEFDRIRDEDLSISALIERANKDIGKAPDDPTIMFGDILVEDGLQNADLCTTRTPGCLWPRSPDKKVYVPYIISNEYSPEDQAFITGVLKTFENSTCLRFTPRDEQQHYIHVKNLEGCYSSVGRRGGEQILSLKRRGCLYVRTVQHEFLHAMGLQHEQSRSDRDQHIRINYENIIPGKEHNFKKYETNNLGTSYDYGSIMHYGRDFFSKNGQPTMVPIPDENVSIGRAKEMSKNDILRINRLYCN